jgi:predicted ATPase
VGALLHQRTGGNPFFLEEICRTLQDEGILRVEERRLVLVRSLMKLPLPISHPPLRLISFDC